MDFFVVCITSSSTHCSLSITSFDTTVFRIQQILLYLENNKYKEEKHPSLPFSCVVSAEIVNVFLPFFILHFRRMHGIKFVLWTKYENSFSTKSYFYSTMSSFTLIVLCFHSYRIWTFEMFSIYILILGSNSNIIKCIFIFSPNISFQQ